MYFNDDEVPRVRMAPVPPEDTWLPLPGQSGNEVRSVREPEGRRDLSEEDRYRVRVANEIGELEVLLQPFARIKPGNALMYFPESNVLIPRVSDPASRTPAFKGAVVNIMPLPAGVPA